MSSTDAYPPAGYRRGTDRPAWDRPTWAAQAWGGLRAAVGWLDDRGRGAWIAATIAGFFLAPPLGVALLLFSLGTGRMFGHRHHRNAVACGWGRRGEMREGWEGRVRSARMAVRPSGNRAFDEYKADTLRRLEEEQAQFEEFLTRLREARDKAEFDQFMDDRARRAQDRSQDRPDDQGDQAA